MDLSLLMCTKVGILLGLSLQHNHFHFQPSHLFLSFWKVIPICDCIWHNQVTYGNVLLPHSTLLATLLCLTSYEQYSTQLLKVLHKCCNTDVVRVLLLYPHSPSGAVCPRDHVYVSVKPFAAMLQPINVTLSNVFYYCYLSTCEPGLFQVCFF